jgi:hypothetical protein
VVVHTPASSIWVVARPGRFVTSYSAVLLHTPFSCDSLLLQLPAGWSGVKHAVMHHDASRHVITVWQLIHGPILLFTDQLMGPASVSTPCFNET